MNTLPSTTCRFAAFLLLTLSSCSGTIDSDPFPSSGAGTSTGGTPAQTGGAPALTGGTPSTAGSVSATGGFTSQGGTGQVNTGGQFGQGGTLATGGFSNGNGGTFGQGSGQATGGVPNGGTGGSANGGNFNRGGSANGGMASGGKSSGGSANGGSATGGSVGDPFGGTSKCSSNTTWKNGENANMRPGEACIACHATNGAPDFTIAGTVYPTGHEPNDCNGKGGVTIVITDANGTAHNISVNSVGNFNFTGNLPKPYTAKVTTTAGGTRAMVTAQTSGDCNSCHTDKGANGAPGRIVAP